MELVEYTRVSARTEKPMSLPARLRHARLGLLTELGEFASSFKKVAIYGKTYQDEKIAKNLPEELGDFMWYAAIIFNALDAQPEATRLTKGQGISPDQTMDMEDCVGVLLDLVGRIWRAVDLYENQPVDSKSDILILTQQALGVIEFHVAPQLGYSPDDLRRDNYLKLQGPGSRYADKGYSDAAAMARADKGGLDDKVS